MGCKQCIHSRQWCISPQGVTREITITHAVNTFESLWLAMLNITAARKVIDSPVHLTIFTKWNWNEHGSGLRLDATIALEDATHRQSNQV